MVSPGMKQQLQQRLDKHIFPGDKVCGAVHAALRAPCHAVPRCAAQHCLVVAPGELNRPLSRGEPAPTSSFHCTVLCCAVSGRWRPACLPIQLSDAVARSTAKLLPTPPARPSPPPCPLPLLQVQVMDISSKTCMFSLLGPQADAVMQQLQAGGLADAPYGSHTLLSFAGGCLRWAGAGLWTGRAAAAACPQALPSQYFAPLQQHCALTPPGSQMLGAAAAAAACRQAGDCGRRRRPAWAGLHLHRRRVCGGGCVAGAHRPGAHTTHTCCMQACMQACLPADAVAILGTDGGSWAALLSPPVFPHCPPDPPTCLPAHTCLPVSPAGGR